MKFSDVLSLVIAGVAAAANVVAVLFVGQQVKHAAHQARSAAEAQQREWERQRRKSTLDFFTATFELNWRLREAAVLGRDKESAAEAIQKARTDHAVYLAIAAYLNFLDTVGVGVVQAVFDLQTVDMIAGSRIIAVATNYADFIASSRASLGPGVWSDVDRLVGMLIDLRRREGRPIPDLVNARPGDAGPAPSAAPKPG